ncbi:MAG: TlpA disulfide reductase family protein [Gammaproteobacteria bacterium]
MRGAIRLSICVAATVLAGCADRDEVPDGPWRVTAELPGGQLPFTLQLTRDEGGLSAVVVNGDEQVEVPRVIEDGSNLTLLFPAFNNRLEMQYGNGELTGTLILVKRDGVEQRMPLHGTHGEHRRFGSPEGGPGFDVSGRWSVVFTEDDGTESAAVGEFRQIGQLIQGTFLKTAGDHRYLAGEVSGEKLYLSTFDGAHAFLFVAERTDVGTLQGDFWSGTQWHEDWTAHADPDAALPDANTMTHLKPGVERFDFSFPDPDGDTVSLSDERFRGKVVVVTLAGSWCPNCHDEARFMAPFYLDKRDDGLEVVALMFEHFGGFERAAEQTRRFREKFGIEYETLIAGTSDKDDAASRLPTLDHLLAFPTTIFIGRDGSVRRIHTGFAGPGTGEYYERLTSEISDFVDELLAEPVPQT